MAVRTGASENDVRTVAHNCRLALALARVKHVSSGELREWHARRWNGLERLGEMIEHGMRLAGKAPPHADRRGRGHESIGIGA